MKKDHIILCVYGDCVYTHNRKSYAEDAERFTLAEAAQEQILLRWTYPHNRFQLVKLDT